MASRQGIFISYRRADTRADAGRLHDRLAERFGSDQVFMDIDDIQPGQNFQVVLQQTLASCRVLLVLIGPGWLRATDQGGLPRLEDKQDLVRLELQTALQRGIPLIPVLFNKAAMPAEDELPAGLALLSQRQALEVSDSRFHADVNALISSLEPILADSGQRRRHRLAASVVVALLASLALFWLAASGRLPIGAAPVLDLRREPELVDRTELLDMLVQMDFYDATLNRAGSGPGGSYEVQKVDGEGVLIDRKTGLMWQQVGPRRQSPLANAVLDIASLNQRAFAGYRDWRLPTIEEAMSLLQSSKESGAHVAPILAPQDTPILWTADLAHEGSVWVIYLLDGTAAVESVEFNAWSRAVRSME